MKLSTREDIEVPIDYAFAQVSDFAALERRAMKLGAQVTRRGDGPVAKGTCWDIDFDFRGHPRQVDAQLTVYEPPEKICFDSASDGIQALTEVALVPLSQTRTRVLVSVDMRAKSFTARLLLQSLKLAKGKINSRFEKRVRDYAEGIEDRFRRGE